VDGHLVGEAGAEQAAAHRVVDPEVRGPVVAAPLHLADGPGVTAQCGKHGPLAQLGLQVAVGRRGVDLGEDDVDHPVEEVVLVGDVVVERHRLDVELLGKLAHPLGRGGSRPRAGRVRAGTRPARTPWGVATSATSTRSRSC
jgi:hypothetical protein